MIAHYALREITGAPRCTTIMSFELDEWKAITVPVCTSRRLLS